MTRRLRSRLTVLACSGVWLLLCALAAGRIPVLYRQNQEPYGAHPLLHLHLSFSDMPPPPSAPQGLLLAPPPAVPTAGGGYFFA